MDKKDKYILELHNWEVSPIKINELNIRRTLKSNITDKLEERFKLSKKSLGYQYLILLGTDTIDIHGHSMEQKK